jgi:nitroreductase
MDTLDAIISRHSVPVPFLAEPAPDDAALRRIIAAGSAAPDHGRLRPWRFVVIRGEARSRLGQVFEEALRRREPDAAEAALEQERGRPLRAPLLLAVLVATDPDHAKIPLVEQVLSGGAAVQNMLLAAHALGYGAKWVTGSNAYDGHVKTALGGQADDVIAGFLHLGTVAGEPPAVPHAEPATHGFEWHGPERMTPLGAG